MSALDGDRAELARPPTGLTVSMMKGLLASKSNVRIARERGASARTVGNQVASVYRKLGVTSRWELAARCAVLMAPPR